MKSDSQDLKNDADMENFVIVVGREFGSCGRRIGQMLARELGISYYDKTLLTEAARQLGLSTEIFERNDERRPSLIRSLLSFTYGATNADMVNTPISDEKIYELQSQVIKTIAKRESCVIVGRTADYMLRDHPRMLSMFVHAPMSVRVARIVESGDATNEKQAAELANKHDRERESYYNYYTNRDGWGRASNYHLTFDSSRISEKSILAIVKSMLSLD